VNKTQLIKTVATTLGSKAAVNAVEAVFDAMARELADGGTVSVTGFGTFHTSETTEQTRRNPHTGDKVTVPARIRPRFRPGQNLKDLVNGDRKVPLDGSAIAKAPKGSLTGGAR